MGKQGQRKKPGPKPGPERVPLYVEVPVDIRGEMERLATANDRSLTAEVVRALREYIGRNSEGGAR